MGMNRLIALDTHACPKVENSKLQQEWEQFILGKNAKPTIRPLIYDSWQRCLEKGVSPFQSKTSVHLGPEQIEEYVSTDPFFRLLRPLLKKLRDVSTDSRQLIIFCDPSGNMVYLDGDVSLMLKAEDMNLVVGSSWSEKNAGTNAIGTALATGSPIQVFAGEHFCHEIQKWTCSAAPIRDPATQNILGIIDLTGLWTTNHPHFLSVVVSTARAAERLLRDQLKLERFRLCEYYQSITRPSNTPLLVLDRGCKVIQASSVLHDQGWIDSNGFLVGAPSISFPIMSRAHWEVEHRKGIWRFELIPYIYGGYPIGAIIQVIPSSIMVSNPIEQSISV